MCAYHKVVDCQNIADIVFELVYVGPSEFFLVAGLDPGPT